MVCSEGDADLPHVGPDVSTDAVLQRLVYNCYKRKTNLIGLTREPNETHARDIDTVINDKSQTLRC